MTENTAENSWKTPLHVFILTRIMASVASLFALSSIPPREITAQLGYQKPVYGKLMELLIGCWERSDGIWYIGIAKAGYGEPAAYAFFPLYPTLIRILNAISPFPPIVAALLISNAAFFLGLVFVYRLAWSEYGREDTASRSIWYLALFPGSLFFFAPYTESLFLCLAAASLWNARKGNWAIAGITGALLALTRNLGVAIALPLALEFFRQRTGLGSARVVTEAKPPWWKASWILLVPVGLLAWALWCNITTGDPLIFVHQQAHWQRVKLMPWTTLFQGLAQAWAFSTGFPGGGYVYEAIAVSGAVILGLYGLVRRKISLPLSTFVWLALIPPLLAPFEGRMLMSCARFVAVLFPVFLVLADAVKKDGVDQAIRLGFTAAYGIAVGMYVSNQYLY